MDKVHVDARQKAELCQTILMDRRFEQVCECLMSGLDEAHDKHLFDSEDWGADIPLVKNGDEMAASLEYGLSLRDCCRAAWLSRDKKWCPLTDSNRKNSCLQGRPCTN